MNNKQEQKYIGLVYEWLDTTDGKNFKEMYGRPKTRSATSLAIIEWLIREDRILWKK